MDLNKPEQKGEQKTEIPTVMPFIKDFSSYLLKKWWLFMIVGLLGGIGGYLYARSQKPLYKSKLTFALDEGGSKGLSGGLASLASQFGLGSGGSNDVFAGDNIIQILKSRNIIERVLLSEDTFNNKRYTLADYYLSQASSEPVVPVFSAGIQRAAFTPRQDSILKKIYTIFLTENLTASRPDRKLNIFEVNVKTNNEQLTKVFTSRLVNAANLFYTELRTKKAKETLSILEERVANMKGNLSSSISDKAAVQDANLNPAFASALVPAAKQQVNIQVYSVAYGEMFKNLEIARFQYLNEIPLLQIIDDAQYPMEKIRLGKLKAAVIGALITGFLLMFIFWIIRVAKIVRSSAS